jgi:hypothetical protein
MYRRGQQGWNLAALLGYLASSEVESRLQAPALHGLQAIGAHGASHDREDLDLLVSQLA